MMHMFGKSVRFPAARAVLILQQPTACMPRNGALLLLAWTSMSLNPLCAAYSQAFLANVCCIHLMGSCLVNSA